MGGGGPEGGGSQRGFGGNERGGGVGQSLIPTQPTHRMERGKSDVGDVVEGGHLRVGGEEPQITPPLSSGSAAVKRERRMVPLRFLSREVLVQAIISMRGGQWTRLVVGYIVQTPDFKLPDPCIDMTRKTESTVLGVG